MTEPLPDGEARALLHAREGLRLARLSLPHLAGLAHMVRLRADPRVGTAGVFPSGVLVINPIWINRLNRREVAYVMAHELLHLALQTHARAGQADRALFNLAHDYVINATLTEAFHMPPPAGGVSLPWAHYESAESLYARLRFQAPADERLPPSWEDGTGPSIPTDSPMVDALRKAGMTIPPDASGSDVLREELLPIWFPDMNPRQERQQVVRVTSAAARSLALRHLSERVSAAASEPSLIGQSGHEPESLELRALSSIYQQPWELALQRWIEDVLPGPRSWARPSRRGEIGAGGVLPGRTREGWTMHVVLDTSASMQGMLRSALGAIASTCAAMHVSSVRVLQCDVGVTSDEHFAPEELKRFTIHGLGGSDMSPAMARLAHDPDVEAAIVITDGEIPYPPGPFPYHVLWAVIGPDDDFKPGYGTVLPVRVERSDPIET